MSTQNIEASQVIKFLKDKIKALERASNALLRKVQFLENEVKKLRADKKELSDGLEAARKDVELLTKELTDARDAERQLTAIQALMGLPK